MKKVSIAIAAVLSAACSQASDPAASNQAFTSHEATLYDFTFKGEVQTSSPDAFLNDVKAQAFYLIGQLDSRASNARVDWTTAKEIERKDLGGGIFAVSYEATVPIAWNKEEPVSLSTRFIFPKRVDSTGTYAFYDKYGSTCRGATDYGADAFWHDFEPRKPSCVLAPGDVSVVEATSKKSALNRATHSYPEYARIWADNELQIAAAFSPDASMSTSDVGVRDHNRSLAELRSLLGLPAEEDGTKPVVTLEKTLPDGRLVKATFFLVDSVLTFDPAFTMGWNRATEKADLVVYAGHSGLSKNIRGLARSGVVTPGQYQIYFMEACNTFAYVDRTIFDRRAENNADDPQGTRHLDFLGTGLPSPFGVTPNSLHHVVKSLIERNASYEDILRGLPSVEMPVVVGDEDNPDHP